MGQGGSVEESKFRYLADFFAAIFFTRYKLRYFYQNVVRWLFQIFDTLKVTIKCILCNYQPRVYSFVVSALFSRRPTGKNASCTKKVGEYIHTREASGGGGQTSGVSGPWWTSVKGLKWHASQKKQEIYFILKNFNYLKFEQCPKVVKCKEHLTIYGNRCTNWKLFRRNTAKHCCGVKQYRLQLM